MSTEQTQQAELTALAPQRILSIRGTIPVAQLGNAMGERLAGLAAALTAQGLQASGPVFARYHSFDPAGDTDVEHGVPVAGTAVSAGQVSAGELPSGDAVSVWHTGDHTTLGQTYGKMGAKVQESGRVPAGPPWEEYHWIDLNRFDTDAASWGGNNASTWRVRLVQPLK